MPLISVVIPNWNGAAFLPACLDALRAQTFRDFETVLVDNGSADESVSLVRRKYPEVTVIELPRNRGFSAAVNQGIQNSSGDIVALLNNDTQADPRWLERAADCMARHPRAGSVACLVVYLGREHIIDSAGDEAAPWGAVFNRGHLHPAGPPFDAETPVFGFCGSAALIRRAVFHDIGLFDETMFAYYEDLDMNLRARLRGWDCVYCPGAVVRHRYSGSTHGTGLKLGTEEVYLHLTGVWLKNMPARVMLRHILSATAFHALILFFHGVARVRGRNCMPRVPVFRFLNAMLQQRPAVQRARTAPAADFEKHFMKMSFFRFALKELGVAGKARRG